MALVMLPVYTKQRAGAFSFQQLMPPGIKPRNIAPHRETRLAVNNTAIDLPTRRKRLLFRIAPENKKAAKFNLCGL
ncbi:hypothetical protein CEW81_01325 [Kluyvera genomosp. 3]|uniref:Uncharacterized protein n=1 Tax=Kluyvera genomosp. 3 TaxID=2774055 RepID=A0A248KGV6_9ENTR|nr:hypothetical protein CEW81_01325 [Kluyvera genomosp. 3]